MKQRVNGSPVNPDLQVHIGLWFTTSQWVFKPHVPGQGFLHFKLIQALFKGHSELTVHSGLQFGGLPKYPGEHVHTACSLLTRH